MSNDKRDIKTVACIGEVMIELVAGPDDSAKLGVAGDTFNTAVYLKRCLRDTDVDVSYVTALGTDPYSDRILDTLGLHGLNASCVERRDDMMPGLYAIDTDDEGERSFSYWRSASAARSLFSEPCDVPLARMGEFDLILISGISMAILPPSVRQQVFDFVDDFRASGGTFAYDSNYRPRLWESVDVAREVNTEMWRRADIALPSVDDEMELFADPDEVAVRTRLAGNGASNGALKRGGSGPMDLASGTVYTPPETNVRVVDSTAAGDSFNAAYLAAMVRGKVPVDALKDGHQMAVKVIGQSGAIIKE